jgi:hypothetical protein
MNSIRAGAPRATMYGASFGVRVGFMVSEGPRRLKRSATLEVEWGRPIESEGAPPPRRTPAPSPRDRRRSSVRGPIRTGRRPGRCRRARSGSPTELDREVAPPHFSSISRRGATDRAPIPREIQLLRNVGSASLAEHPGILHGIGISSNSISSRAGAIDDPACGEVEGSLPNYRPSVAGIGRR